MKDIESLRQQIDMIDEKMLELFELRMAACRQVGLWKMLNSKPIYDAEREEELIKSKLKMLEDKSLAQSAEEFFRNMMDLSKKEQLKLCPENN